MPDDKSKTPGKGSHTGIIIVGAVLIFLVIIIWLWTTRAKEDGDDIIPDGQPDGPSIEWHDHNVKPGMEQWIGWPASNYWIAIWYRPWSPPSWVLYIFPHPGGNPYTGAGQQIGLGGSFESLQELYDDFIRLEYLQVRGYSEGYEWLIYMRDHVFPDYGEVII